MNEIVRNFSFLKYAANGTEYYLFGFAIVDEEDPTIPLDVFIHAAFDQHRAISSETLESFFDYQVALERVQEYFKALDNEIVTLQAGD